jgi:hypothetical protein
MQDYSVQSELSADTTGVANNTAKDVLLVIQLQVYNLVLLQLEHIATYVQEARTGSQCSSCSTYMQQARTSTASSPPLDCGASGSK